MIVARIDEVLDRLPRHAGTVCWVACLVFAAVVLWVRVDPLAVVPLALLAGAVRFA